MTKEDKLINAISDLADEQLGGERSKKALYLFTDIAAECRELGFTRLARIAQGVAARYDYGTDNL
jgi:hypothetical protein